MRPRRATPATTTNQRTRNAARSDGTKGLRVLLRLRGSQDSINLKASIKKKFIIKLIPPKEHPALPIQKSEQLAKLMTSKVRRHVKPGSMTFDSVEEAASIFAAAFVERSMNLARIWRLVFFLAGYF